MRDAVKTAARYCVEWAVLVLGLALHAVWFVIDAAKELILWIVYLVWYRYDQQKYTAGWFANNLGLDANDTDGDPTNGVREGLLRIFKPGELLRKRFTHDVKNFPFEWVKSDPKRAVRVLAFIALVGWLL